MLWRSLLFRQVIFHENLINGVLRFLDFSDIILLGQIQKVDSSKGKIVLKIDIRRNNGILL